MGVIKKKIGESRHFPRCFFTKIKQTIEPFFDESLKEDQQLLCR
jgi:hypothetical protein